MVERACLNATRRKDCEIPEGTRRKGGALANSKPVNDKLRDASWEVLLILKILHDLNILWYHNYQSIRYLGSCRNF